MSKDSSYQRVRSHLSYLGLGAASERLAPALEAAEQKKPAYAEFLDRLLGAEVEATEQRRLERRLRLAGFPHQKALEQFDFSAQPGLDRLVLIRSQGVAATRRRASALFTRRQLLPADDPDERPVRCRHDGGLEIPAVEPLGERVERGVHANGSGAGLHHLLGAPVRVALEGNPA